MHGNGTVTSWHEDEPSLTRRWIVAEIERNRHRQNEIVGGIAIIIVLLGILLYYQLT